MYVTKKMHCDFVLWSPGECSIERIYFDPEFCEKMVPKLERFYKEAMLPELVQPRLSRSMEIKEASYVLEARKSLEAKGKAKRPMADISDSEETDEV